MDYGPIFIGGLDRSGKSFMRLMLASHPNIDMACRTNMWPRFYNQYGDLSHRMNFERCLDAMLHYKHVAVLKPDLDRIRREFWQGPPTYARLFALVQQQHAEREGKSRWGDQTEWIERYADPIFAAYPDAKMIHMIRDPRDRYEASASRWSRGKGKVGGAIAKWLYSMDLAKRNQRRYLDRYQIVRYEALVTHPEETLDDVCVFLKEGCAPAMLMSKEHMGHKGALSTAFIGRYRQAISKYDIAFMQRYAGRDMLAYGYSLEPIHFSFAERLHFTLIDWPMNLVR
ncbi:MAG TPA: sulfotransferase, partial [Anaerolineae bacterium]|nr:sulfotransferase [Anaerolineae bacterium]